MPRTFVNPFDAPWWKRGPQAWWQALRQLAARLWDTRTRWTWFWAISGWLAVLLMAAGLWWPAALPSVARLGDWAQGGDVHPAVAATVSAAIKAVTAAQ